MMYRFALGLTSRTAVLILFFMPERHFNEADTIGLLAELREFCARLARQWSLSEAQLHRLIRDFAHPELSAPERSFQFKVEQWDKTEDHIIWLIAVSNNFLVAGGHTKPL
jgi:hypothetical protein